MSIATDFDLSQAMASFAAANTPSYLVRKLQEDPTVLAISRRLDGKELIAELEAAVREKPKSLQEAVLPYVCLVALYMQPTSSFLQKSTTIRAEYKDKWFDYIRQILIETYQPNMQQTILVPTTINISSPGTNLIPTQQMNIIIEG